MSAVIGYVRETWPRASEAVENVLYKTYDATVNGMILGRPTWLSRQIEDWSHRILPPATAKVMAATIIALPSAALFFLTPPLFVALIPITIYSAQFLFRIGRAWYTSVEELNVDLTNGHDLLNQTMDTTTPGLAFVLAGIVHVANGTFGRDVYRVVYGTAEMLTGLTCLLDSGFLGNVRDAVRELGSVQEYV